MTSETPATPHQPRALAIIAVLSIAIPAAVAFLLFVPQTGKLGGLDVTFIPKVNAVLNSLTAVALAVGYGFIRRGNVAGHRASMLSAFTLSTGFLVLYVLYHTQAPSTHFGGVGLIRPVYFAILISHILLAIIIVPLVLTALYFALTRQFSKHKAVTRWTLPIWLYVAVTGVLAYLMIAPYYPWNR